jgi:predicted ATPase
VSSGHRAPRSGLVARGQWIAQRPPFVGRGTELRQLRAAFDAAAGGEGGLVLLAGEPGIGKTALCEQLAAVAATGGGQVLVGHCYEAGSFALPYQPFIEAFDAYASHSDVQALRQELGTGASDLARLVHSLRELLHVEPSAAGDPVDDRWRLFMAVLAFVRRAGAARPILLVIEDLHDADRATLDLLVYLAHNLADTPLLVVCTYRDVDVDRAHCRARLAS